MVERKKIASFLYFYHDYILEGIVFEDFFKLNLNAKWQVCTGCLKIVNFVLVADARFQLYWLKLKTIKSQRKNKNSKIQMHFKSKLTNPNKGKKIRGDLFFDPKSAAGFYRHSPLNCT